MARKRSKETLRVFDKLDQAPNEDIEHYYRRLAKQADQRLVRLEAAAHDPHYRGIKNWAYRRAIKDIEHWSGEGSLRFNTKPPSTRQELEAKIQDIRQFLEAPTSTKSGVTKTYKKRADTINKNLGTNLTWDQLANFWESDKSRIMASELGSDVAIMIQNAIDNKEIELDLSEAEKQRLKDEALLDAIQNAPDKIIRVDDENLKDRIVEALEKNLLSPEEVLQGVDFK